MDETRQKDDQILVQVIRTEMPLSIKVFGILNCVFGGFYLLFLSGMCFIVILSPHHFKNQTAETNKLPEFLPFAVIIGFSIWEIFMGTALLRFKKWARKGNIIYACCVISLIIICFAIEIYSLSAEKIKMSENSNPAFEAGLMAFSFLSSLIYPVLLLIFMKTDKVKQAFARIENG